MGAVHQPRRRVGALDPLCECQCRPLATEMHHHRPQRVRPKTLGAVQRRDHVLHRHSMLLRLCLSQYSIPHCDVHVLERAGPAVVKRRRIGCRTNKDQCIGCMVRKADGVPHPQQQLPWFSVPPPPYAPTTRARSSFVQAASRRVQRPTNPRTRSQRCARRTSASALPTSACLPS